MPKFQYNKLIRDQIYDLAIQDWASLDAEYITWDVKVLALITKIAEESDELLKAMTREDKIAELADLQEIIDALWSTLNISKEEVFKAQEFKKQKKWWFEKWLFAHSMTVNENHHRYQYFKDNSDKYPEIE